MENEIKELNIKQILVCVLILVLFHSLYLIETQKDKVKNIDTLSDYELLTQVLYNRLVVFIVLLYFTISAYTNYINNESENNLIVFITALLPFIAVCIDIVNTINNLDKLKE